MKSWRWAIVWLAFPILLAGCTASQEIAPSTIPPLTPPVRDTLNLEEIPFHLDGNTGFMACASGPSIPGPCVEDGVLWFLDPFPPSHLDFEDDQQPVRVRGNLSWEAMTPRTEELTITISGSVDGEPWLRIILRETAPSPLSFDAPLGDIPPGTHIQLGVYSGEFLLTPGGVAAWHGVPQDFILEGIMSFSNATATETIE